MSLTESSDRAFERSQFIEVRFLGGAKDGQRATVRLDQHTHDDRPSGHHYARHTFGASGQPVSFYIWDGLTLGQIQAALDAAGKAP